MWTALNVQRGWEGAHRLEGVAGTEGAEGGGRACRVISTASRKGCTLAAHCEGSVLCAAHLVHVRLIEMALAVGIAYVVREL